MTDFVDPSISSRRIFRKRILSGLVIFAESGGFIGLACLLLTGRLIDALVVLQLMMALALPVAVMWATVRRHRNWHQPLGQLQELIPQVRDGLEPIESLGKVGGKLAPLAALCQQMLRDVREEKLRIMQLEEEVRQRIATRTEALERRIGALRQQAARDALTGLFNRRALDDYLPEAVDRCKSARAPLCVIMIDIDNFKPLNDTLGHAAGDQMLRSLSQIIRSTIREGDVAFRNGGDEFVIVMEDCGPETAAPLADRIASLADAFGKTFRVERPPELSIGLAHLEQLPDPTAQALLRAADQALYKVKTAHHAASGAPARKRSA